MRKLILLIGVIAGALLLGLNAQNLASLELLSDFGLSEKLGLLSLSLNRTLVVLGAFILLLLILLKVNYSQHMKTKDLRLDLDGERSISSDLRGDIEVKDQSIVNLRTDVGRANSALREKTAEVIRLESDKNRLDGSLKKLDKVATFIEKEPALIQGIDENYKLLLDNNSKLAQMISMQSGQSDLGIQKIVADLDLASTMSQIKDAEVNEDLDFDYSEAVDLLLSLEQKFGIDSKEFVVMAWVISNIMYESHHGVTAGFAKQLKQRTEKIFPVLKQNEEDDDFLDEVFISYEK